MSESAPAKRVQGITWLKAFLPLLVIACHARPFGESACMRLPLAGVPNWEDIFYVNVLSLPVPVFYLMSFFLYLAKRDRIDYSPRKLMHQRVVYFATLFFGVRLVYLLAGIGTLYVPGRGEIRNLYHLLFAGGDTLLYYLEQMVYWTVLLECLCAFCERIRIERNVTATIGIVLGGGMVGLCDFFFSGALRVESLRFFSPVGFLPLPFIAMLAYELKERIANGAIVTLLALGLAMAIAEWRLLPSEEFLQSGYSMAMPSYARISVLMLACAVFLASLRMRLTPNALVVGMAGLSLYVYCVHQLVIVVLGDVIRSPLIDYIVVVALTYCVSFLLRAMAIRIQAHKTKG